MDDWDIAFEEVAAETVKANDAAKPIDASNAVNIFDVSYDETEDDEDDN